MDDQFDQTKIFPLLECMHMSDEIARHKIQKWATNLNIGFQFEGKMLGNGNDVQRHIK